MNRILASLSIGLLCAASAVAQCTGSPATTIGSGDDTLFTPHFPLGFSMPVAGSALGSYTHFRANCNGWLILTDGVTTPAGTPSGYGSSTILAGLTAGYAPRVAAFWRDLTVNSTVQGSRVSYDNTTNAGVSCRIQWYKAADFGTGGPFRTFEMELFATGDIQFRYDAMNVQGASDGWVGVSRGNAQTTVAATDISAGVATAGVGMFYQRFPTGTFDLGNGLLNISPDGLGGWNAGAVAGPCANHSQYNNGCYTYTTATEAFYEYFATPADTSSQLTGTSITLTPNVNGYLVTSGGGAYVAPSGGALTLVTGDDVEANVVPSVAFPYLTGPIATLGVSSNGNINMAAVPTGNSTTAWGDVALLLNAAVASFRSNGDYDLDPADSPGQIKYEEISNILFVTWENTERFGVNGTSDRWQMQMNLLSGVVVIVWDNMANSGTGTSIDTVVGYSPGGGSNDPGSIDLATALPIVTQPDINLAPLTLSASPSPTFTLGGSSVPITYTTTNLRDLAPAVPGFYLAIMVFSINVAPPGPGFDLTFVGIDAPGCDLNLGSLDVVYNITPTSATHNEVIVVPQPLSPGDTFYVQSFNFLIPNTLPNGQNNFGLTSSNGVSSYFQTF